MSESNWRELLRAQHQELGLENDEVQLSEDIDRILRKPMPSTSTINMISQIKASTSVPNSANSRSDTLAESSVNSSVRNSQDHTSYSSSVNNTARPSSSSVMNSARAASTGRARNSVSSTTSTSISSNKTGMKSRLSTGGGTSSNKGPNSSYFSGTNNNNEDNIDMNNAISEPSLLLAGAPEANSKYQQAKIKLLTSQVQENVELRRHLNEQITDLQKQLKTEKDETRNLKKRLALVLVDNIKVEYNISEVEYIILGSIDFTQSQ